MGATLPDITKTWFECINIECGHKVSLASNTTFKCPKCGELQSVKHDLSTYKLSTPHFVDSIKRRFKQLSSQSGLDVLSQSGVWKYSGNHGLVMPGFPVDKMITLGEGNEPFLEAGPNMYKWLNADIGLWIMMQGMNPTGSFKDRGMCVAVSVASALGAKAIICASTGDTSAAAAIYAARAGMKCYVLIPGKKGSVTIVQWHQPDAYGARMIVIPGDFDKGMAAIQKFADTGEILIVNSRNSLRIEGHKSTPIRIAEKFDWDLPDAIFAPLGNGSDVSSIAEGSENLLNLGFISKPAKIFGVQVSSAPPLYNAWEKASAVGDVTEHTWMSNYAPVDVGETVATAMNIGNPVSRRKVVRGVVRSNGAMEVAEESELLEIMDIANKEGLPICPHTAVMLVGVKKAYQDGKIKKGDRVVGISTASQMKFPETLADHRDMDIVKARDCDVDTIGEILDL